MFPKHDASDWSTDSRFHPTRSPPWPAHFQPVVLRSPLHNSPITALRRRRRTALSRATPRHPTLAWLFSVICILRARLRSLTGISLHMVPGAMRLIGRWILDPVSPTSAIHANRTFDWSTSRRSLPLHGNSRHFFQLSLVTRHNEKPFHLTRHPVAALSIGRRTRDWSIVPNSHFLFTCTQSRLIVLWGEYVLTTSPHPLVDPCSSCLMWVGTPPTRPSSPTATISPYRDCNGSLHAPLARSSCSAIQHGLKTRQRQLVSKCSHSAPLHPPPVNQLSHHRTARHRQTNPRNWLLLIYLLHTIHPGMSPMCSPAAVELQLVPPDEPSPTTPTSTCVRGGEATCDPTPTSKQQPHHDTAIQDHVMTTVEAGAVGEDSDSSDYNTGE